MYDFHGWATIREATNEEGENSEYCEQIVVQIQEKIAKLDWPSGIMDLRWVNGEPHLCTSGCRNHKDSVVDELFDIYEYIAKIAPGSFGILYTLDDDFELNYRVFVLVRGTLVEHGDPFLSPFIPIVEDKS